MDLQALKTELNTDPNGVGYAALSDEAAAEKFKLTNRPVNRESIDGGLLASAIVRSEYAALNAADKDYVRLLCATATPIPLTASFKTEVGGVFGAGTQTRTNFLALLKRTGNRAEELGLGGVPTTSDIANARRL